MFSVPSPVSARAAGPARAVRIWVLLNRRWLAAGCAALCAWATVQTLAPEAPSGTAVTVAARDLPAGQVLRAADLREVVLPDAVVPAGLAPAPEGRTLTGPMRAGEPLTDARVLSPGLPDHLEGLAGVPVRIADLDVVGLLRVGDRVDVVAVDPRGAGHRSVARSGLVIALPDAAGGGEGRRATQASGALVVLGVPDDSADDLAAAGAGEVLQVVFRGRRP